MGSEETMLKKPAFCSIEVLYSCVLRCKMCYMWRNARMPDELSIAEWKKFIQELKEFSGTKTAINITGGEPLLKENVLELVEYINQEGFTEVSMTTNGFLIGKETVKRIADAGLRMISFSLDSISAGIHDRVRGVNGAQAKVLGALDYFAGYPGTLKKLGIQTIIMGPNLEGIPDLVEWADKKKISIYFMAIAQPLCLPLDDTWHLASEHAFLWPADMAKLNKVIDYLVQCKEKGFDIGNSLPQLRAFKSYFSDPTAFVKKQRQCKMGEGMVKVGPAGEVALCGEKGAIGNVRDQHIERIWLSEAARRVREAIAACRTNCPQLVNCYFEE